MITKELIKNGFNIQFFADGEEQSTQSQEEGQNSDSNANTSANGEEHEETEKKYTDEDVNKIINKKFAVWKAEHEKALSEAKTEAEKLAKMNADQKRDYEIEKLKEENEKYKALEIKTELGKEATKQLKEKSIDATPEILEFVVGENAEATSKKIDSFVEIIEKQLALKEAERAKGTSPKNYNGESSPKKKEDIFGIKNPVERQRAIAENIELFR